jgi:Ca-activated chloride channel homolog
VKLRLRSPFRRRPDTDNSHVRRHGRVALIAALAVLIPLSTYGIVRGRNAPVAACPDRAPVTLQVDPRIAAVVSAVLRDVGPGPECVPVQVDQRSSADLAFDLAQPVTAQLSIPLPDVWIPDSSAWLATASTTAEGGQRVSAPAQLSIATSPVVAAMRRNTATALGWPGMQLGWSGLLSAKGGSLKVALTNAQSDGAGLLAVLAQQRGLGQLSPQLLRFTRRVVIPPVSDFKGQSPTSAVASRLVDAVSASEQDVIEHNREQPRRPLVAEYDDERTASFDFPFVPIADAVGGTIRLDKKHDEDVVQARLISPEAQRAFTAAGFRTTTGQLDHQYGTAQGVEPTHNAGFSESFAPIVRQVQKGWPILSRRGRVLIVVDESGSMAERLPGSPLSKMELARQALGAVVRQVAPDTDVGLWTFTSSARQDYRVRVTLGPVNGAVGDRSRRAALAEAVSRLVSDPRGGTGLYDTTLAAFRSASQNYLYGRLNAVLIVTDGRNEDDPKSISLTTLLQALRTEFRASQPVRIVTAGYGQDVDRATLERITSETGGRSYSAVVADQVGPLLAAALAQL